MCGIAGFLNPRNNDKKTEEEIYQILKKMNEVQKHLGFCACNFIFLQLVHHGGYFWKMAVH